MIYLPSWFLNGENNKFQGSSDNALVGDWISRNWPGRDVIIKANVFHSLVGKCTNCSKWKSFRISMDFHLLNSILLFGPYLNLYLSFIDCFVESWNYSILFLASMPVHSGSLNEFSIRNCTVWPMLFFWMFSLLLKEPTFIFYSDGINGGPNLLSLSGQTISQKLKSPRTWTEGGLLPCPWFFQADLNNLSCDLSFVKSPRGGRYQLAIKWEVLFVKTFTQTD